MAKTIKDKIENSLRIKLNGVEIALDKNRRITVNGDLGLVFVNPY